MGGKIAKKIGVIEVEEGGQDRERGNGPLVAVKFNQAKTRRTQFSFKMAIICIQNVFLYYIYLTY